MADKRWKRVEREKCRALGGERRGPTGRDLPDSDDSIHVALEVKSYKKFVFLTKDWVQAVHNAAKINKPPVLAVKETGQNGRDRVQMRMRDFNALVPNWGVEIPNVEFFLGGFDNSLVRLDWKDFVQLYRAAYNLDEKE